MSLDYNHLVDDLAAEQAALERVLAVMPETSWDAPTHAPGWLTRDQVAHLAFFDEKAALAIKDPDAFRAHVAELQADESTDLERSYITRSRAMTPTTVLAWWREASSFLITVARPLDAKARMPWYGPDMSGASFITARLMETWSHGLDIVDAVGIPRPDTDRLKHVATLGVRTRGFSYLANGMTPPPDPVYVELVAPSGERWSFGEPDAANRITGSATDFCRVVTQRRHPADTNLVVDGPAAEEWMAIAQAFAGPPGVGRQPGEFGKEGPS